jgi:broad specificity phosphatase PhoE
MPDKQLYCIRHGESQFNEWRTRSLYTFSWVFTRDPMILDPRLSTKGELQVRSASAGASGRYHRV